MEKKIFYNVEDVMTMLMISKSHAYKIIRELNQDLKAQGYMTITLKLARLQNSNTLRCCGLEPERKDYYDII